MGNRIDCFNGCPKSVGENFAVTRETSRQLSPLQPTAWNLAVLANVGLAVAVHKPASCKNLAGQETVKFGSNSGDCVKLWKQGRPSASKQCGIVPGTFQPET